MYVGIISEHGYKQALFGLSLSYEKERYTGITQFDIERQQKVAERLAGKGNGHDKFLRMITVYIEIIAPMYWWKEMDTYGVGVVKQSASTMHTLGKGEITPDQFEGQIPGAILSHLNMLAKKYRKAAASGHSEDARNYWDRLIRVLPMSFLQHRLVMCNYAVLQNIIRQRRGHKLPEWKYFIDTITQDVEHPELLKGTEL